MQIHELIEAKVYFHLMGGHSLLGTVVEISSLETTKSTYEIVIISDGQYKNIIRIDQIVSFEIRNLPEKRV